MKKQNSNLLFTNQYLILLCFNLLICFFIVQIKVDKVKIYGINRKLNNRQLSVDVQVDRVQFQQSYFKTNAGQQALKQIGPIPPPNKAKKIIEVEKKIEEEETKQTNQIEEDLRINNTSKTKSFNKKSIYYRPSVFQLEDIEQLQIEKQKQQQAQQHCQQKTKSFNLYGNKREFALKVPSILRTNPEAKINERYIVQDSNWENRTACLGFEYPIEEEIRYLNTNVGAHKTLNDLQDKRHSVMSLIERDNMGLISDIHDDLKRNVLIQPVKALFGIVQVGKLYQMKLNVKNEDIMIQRINIRQPSQKYTKVFQAEVGPIALGLSRDVIVQIDASKDILGLFEDKFEIVTKQQIFTIPVRANIISQEEFEKLDQESLIENNKRVLKPAVKEINREQINKTLTILENSMSNNNLPKISERNGQDYRENIINLD